MHPGLSNSEIDRLPVSVYNTTPAAEGATACGNSAVAFSEHRACKICMCDYEDGDVIRTLPCYHRFHSECIDEWLGVSTTPKCQHGGTSIRGDRQKAIVDTRFYVTV